MLTSLVAVVISQCIRAANHHVLLFNLHSGTCHLYLNKAGNIINISSTANKVELFCSWFCCWYVGTRFWILTLCLLSLKQITYEL